MGKSIESGHRKKFINLVLRVMMTVIYIGSFHRFNLTYQISFPDKAVPDLSLILG